MNIALLRATVTTGLVVVALCAISPPAGVAGTGVGEPLIASAAEVQCPCNPDLARHFVANKWSSLCPCNAGLPDGPSGALAVPALRATAAPSLEPRATAPASHSAFDWADAGVGAGFAVALGVLVAGGALVFNRRRVPAQLTAGSRR